MNEGKGYSSNGSRTANSVKRILGLSKCQIYNTVSWRNIIFWGCFRTAKSEGYVPISVLRQNFRDKKHIRTSLNMV